MKKSYTEGFYKVSKSEEPIAFHPKEIYRLWQEKDIAIYDVLEECTDDYIKEVIIYWAAEQYDTEAIDMLLKYISMRERFNSK